MKTKLVLLFSIFLIVNTYGQKGKIKGNKIISTEQREIEAFNTAELFENFNVVFNESDQNMIEIETDENIHEVIEVTVKDSVLRISSSKEITRNQALNIKISYASVLKKIILRNKVEAKSLSSFNSPVFQIEMNDQSEAFLTVNSDKLNCISNGKSKAELHVTAKEVMFQINENSTIKGIITADSLKVDLYQKGSAKLEGEVKSMLVRADNNTDFYGEKLTSIKTKLIAEGASDCFMLTKESITIEAKDTAEVFILGDPKIEIPTFTNEAVLYKKNLDYVPSKIRL